MNIFVAILLATFSHDNEIKEKFIFAIEADNKNF
jgi:hypothetical protein